MSSLLKPGAQSYGPALINGSPGNSVQCMSQKRWGSEEGRALWPNTDVLPAELEKRLNWNQIIIKIIVLGSFTEQGVALEDSEMYLNPPVYVQLSEQLYLIISLVVIFFFFSKSINDYNPVTSLWNTAVPTAALWCV